MGFWSWLTQPWATPQMVSSPWADNDVLTAATLQALFDLDAEMLPMTRTVAMSIPAVARARNTLCGTAAQLQLVAHKLDGVLDPQPSLVSQIDPGRPNSVTLAWIVDELIFNGVAYLVVVTRDAPSNGGRPSGLRVVPQARIGFNPDGSPASFDGHPIPPDDWIRIDGLNEGVLLFGRKALRDAEALANSSAKAARNPVPSVELHQTTTTPTLTAQEIADLKADWIRARDGKNGGVAYTPSSIEAKMHGQAAEQLLIQGRQQSAIDMARIMSVPGWAVDAQQQGSSLTYSNVESRVRELLAFGLQPLLTPIEDRFSMDDLMPHGTWAKFDTSAILAGDLKARAEAYQAAETAGILDQDQARALERGITPKEN